MLKTYSFVLLWCVLLGGCTSVPEGVTPVQNFSLQRYLGTWYEIARFDHSFERGLQQVTAEYSLREDDGVKVINRGFNPTSGEWKEAVGKAYFVGDDDVGHLKVSFFGPFYASYVIAELDQDGYQYALVSGPDRSYLWILARQPQIPQAILDRLIERAAELDFDVSQLIFVEQKKPQRS